MQLEALNTTACSAGARDALQPRAGCVGPPCACGRDPRSLAMAVLGLALHDQVPGRAPQHGPSVPGRTRSGHC